MLSGRFDAGHPPAHAAGLSTAPQSTTRPGHGAAAAAAGFLIWGIVPIYWKQMQEVSAFELIAHRITWSLFFLLVKVVNLFHYLKVGISFLLAFVGMKLLFHSYLDKIGYENVYSLYIIAGTLVISILASIIFPQRKKLTPDPED